VVMRVPVEVRGTAQDGSVIEETAHTGVVGALGALVRTASALKMGTEVALTNQFPSRQLDFVSCGSGKSRPAACGKSASNPSRPWMTSGVCAFPEARSSCLNLGQS